MAAGGDVGRSRKRKSRDDGKNLQEQSDAQRVVLLVTSNNEQFRIDC